MGAKGRLETALKTTSLFDYWQLCNANGLWNQWTYVIHRGKSWEETELKWLQLPLSPFCLSFISSALPLLLLFDGHFPNFRTGWTEMLAFLSSSSCCYPFHFLVLVSGWQVKLSSRVAAHPSLCCLRVLNREINNTERGRVLEAVILKEAVTLKKKAY